jgi:hypothetical protein
MLELQIISMMEELCWSLTISRSYVGLHLYVGALQYLHNVEAMLAYNISMMEELYIHDGGAMLAYNISMPEPYNISMMEELHWSLTISP